MSESIVRALVLVAALGTIVLACAHAPTRESCLAQKGYWGEEKSGGGRCYDDKGDVRTLDAIALGSLDAVFGSPTLPATTDGILGWSVQRGAKTTCGDDTKDECTAGPIAVGAESVTLRFHLKPVSGEPRAYAVDLEDVDGAALKSTVSESLGKSVSGCPSGHEEIWVLDGGLLRIGEKKATFLASGKACP